MRRRLAGERLHRILAACLDRDTLVELVEPTLADLQHEVTSTTSRTRRARALLSGYLALARVLAVYGVGTGRGAAHLGIVVCLGVVGAALAAWAMRQHADPRAVNSASMLPAVAAAMVFSALDRTRGFWRLFLPSAAAAALPWILDEWLIAFSQPASSTLLLIAIRLGNGLVFVSIAAALAAAGMMADRARAPIAARAAAALAYAGVVAGVLFVGLRVTTAAYTPSMAASVAPFLVMLFAMILAVTALPVVLIARGWIGRRVPLAVLAASCFPLPVVAGGALHGRAPADALAACFRLSPDSALALAYAVGMGALGWLLADRGAARRAFPASGVRALIVAGAIAAAGAAPAAQRPDGAEEAAAFYARYLVAVRDAKSVDDIVKFWSAALARQYAQAPPAERADLAGVKGIYGMHTQVSVTGGAVNQVGLVLGLTGLDARQDRTVTGTVTLVKEDGAWKVAAPESWAR